MKTTSLAAAVVLVGASMALAACGSTGSASSAATATATTTSTDTGTTKAMTMTAAGNGWCTAKDLDIKVDEGHSPTAANRLFVIHFAGRAGVHCTIGGTLSDVQFRDASGAPLTVEIGGGQDTHYQEVKVGDGADAVVYVKAGPAGAGAAPVARIDFTLPGKGTAGARVSAPWPSAVNGPMQFTNLAAPVS